MHYYKFNIADWHLATSHLSLEEEAVYFKLINFYYDSEKAIPLETDSVIRRLRLGSFKVMVGIVLEEFFVLQDDGWHHLRCDDEISKYHHKAEINQKIGKLGGRPKKTETVSVGIPKITLTTNQEPQTINHKPIKNITPVGFDLFWNSYDKKVGKPNSLKAWSKIKFVEGLLETIVEKAKADKTAKPDNKFRKDPERWLKGQHWLDEVVIEQAPEQKLMPLGTDAQIEAAYRIECGGDPTQSRFNSYQEMRKFIQEFRDRSK